MSEILSTTKVDRSLARSVAWNAASDWTSQLFSWASFLIVTRLLSPIDFGIVAMAVILVPFFGAFSAFGIPRAVLALRDLTEDQLAQLNSVGLLLGSVCCGVIVLLAKPFATFFKTPRLALVLMVMSTGLIFNGAQAVSNGILLRHKRFRLLSLYAGIAAVTSAAITLLLAWLRMGYWALILGNLLAGILRNVLVLATRRQTYSLPRMGSVRKPLKFGWHVVVSLIAFGCYMDLDNFTAGRVLGQTALGLYGMAWTLANVPLEKVASMVTTVVPTYLVSVKDDLGAIRRYIRTLTEGVALLMFPACVGLGLVAHEFVLAVLGSKWEGTIAPLQILSIYAAFRSIVALLPKMLIALGNPRFVMWNDLATLVALGLAFYIGSHWGIAGIAWGWVAGYPLVVVPLYRKALSTIEMAGSEYWRAIYPAFEATILMTFGILLLKHVLPPSLPVVLKLAIELLTGAICYGSILYLRHRARVLPYMRLAMNFRR